MWIIHTDASLLDPAGDQFANSNAPGATRFAYRVKNQDPGSDTPRYLKINDSSIGARPNGEFFVPIAIYRNNTYFWAFDNHHTSSSKQLIDRKDLNGRYHNKQ